MLKPQPIVLAALLKRYESLAAQAGEAGPEAALVQREMQDAAYTLCVSTGTRDIEAARQEARRMLSESVAAAAAPQPPTAVA